MSAARAPAKLQKPWRNWTVPHSRNGKHKKIVSMILRDLEQLKGRSSDSSAPCGNLGTRKKMFGLR